MTLLYLLVHLCSLYPNHSLTSHTHFCLLECTHKYMFNMRRHSFPPFNIDFYLFVPVVYFLEQNHRMIHCTTQWNFFSLGGVWQIWYSCVLVAIVLVSSGIGWRLVSAREGTECGRVGWRLTSIPWVLLSPLFRFTVFYVLFSLLPFVSPCNSPCRAPPHSQLYHVSFQEVEVRCFSVSVVLLVFYGRWKTLRSYMAFLATLITSGLPVNTTSPSTDIVAKFFQGISV